MLEKLLNKLIKMGRKPFGNSRIVDCVIDGKEIKFYKGRGLNGFMYMSEYSLNDIYCRESLLWDFIIEKELFKKTQEPIRYDGVNLGLWDKSYRLMLSSIHRDKGRFLLNSIEIDD